MKCKNVYEFLVWDNCNNHCSFCFQRDKCVNLNVFQKANSLKKVLEFLNSDKYIKGSHVLLVGGEIFDNSDGLWSLTQDCEKLSIWCDFIDAILNKMCNGDIDLLYVNTNLLYNDYRLLNWLLIRLAQWKLFDRFKFTTSYDLEGRFHTKEREQLFLDNLKKFKEPDVVSKDMNIVVNTILTKKTCESILDGSFNPKEFCDEYKCDINLLPYIIYDEKLSAEPKEIFKALIRTDRLIPGYFKRYWQNLSLDQDKLLYKYNPVTNELDFCSSKKSDCGHSVNFKMYAKNGHCFICDLLELASFTAQG